jgi:hypothetical protein
MISRWVTKIKRQVWLLQAEGARRAASIIEMMSFSLTRLEAKDLTDLRVLRIWSNFMVVA